MTNLDQLNPDFRDILAALCDHGAEFLIVGAYALSFHGHARTTADIDLLIRPGDENARRVWAALAHFGAPLRAADLTVEDLARAGTVYQIGVPPRRIDIINDVSGVGFDDAWASRVEVIWGARKVAFLGIDALLVNKRAAGRPKDLADVAALEAIRRNAQPARAKRPRSPKQRRQPRKRS